MVHQTSESATQQIDRPVHCPALHARNIACKAAHVGLCQLTVQVWKNLSATELGKGSHAHQQKMFFSK